MQIFTRDPQVIELGAKVLRLVAVSEPFFAVVIIMEGIFNGVGDTKVPFFFSLFTIWGIRIPSTAILVLVFHQSLSAVWLCMIADNMVRFICVIVRYKRGRWRQNASII